MAYVFVLVWCQVSHGFQPLAKNRFFGSWPYKVVRFVNLVLANEVLCLLLELGHVLTIFNFYFENELFFSVVNKKVSIFCINLSYSS